MYVLLKPVKNNVFNEGISYPMQLASQTELHLLEYLVFFEKMPMISDHMNKGVWALV